MTKTKRLSAGSKPKAPDSNTKPVHLVFEIDLLKEIQAFRFKYCFNTRIETIKVLIKMGLEAARNGYAPPKSKDF